jgi:hypothetical protein
VVDARSGAPLEDYWVELGAPAAAEEPPSEPRKGVSRFLSEGGELVVTNAEGRFESALERAPGPIRALLRDSPAAPFTRFGGGAASLSPPTEQTVEWDGESEVALTASSGPTYRVRFAPPPGTAHGDFDALLYEGDPARMTYGSFVSSIRGRLRGRDPSVARFPAGKFHREEVTSWTLRIESRDGLWVGDVAVPRCADDCADEQWIELVPAACLEVEVAGPGPELPEARLGLRELDTDRYEGRLSWDLELGEGQVAFGGLPGGRYRLSVQAEGMQAQDLDLVLVPGQRLRERFELAPIPVPARVRGELRSRSGRYRGCVNINALGEVDSQTRHAIPEWIERDGELVAPFEFTDLAPGPVRLMLHDMGVPLRWHPDPGNVQAPAEGLVFVCDDLSPPRRARLRVVDALEGTPVEGFDAQVQVDGIPQALEADPSAPQEQLFWIGVDSELVWRVTAPGYAPEEGTALHLVNEGEDLALSVRLARTP